MTYQINQDIKYAIVESVLRREISKLQRTGKLNENDEHYDSFVNTILPSCLFRWLVNEKDTQLYVCPFEGCHESSKQPRFAKIHIYKVHSKEIPEGVFSPAKFRRNCDVCLAGPFKNVANLNKHLKSRPHLKKVTEKGVADTKEKEKYNSIVYGEEQYELLLKKETKELEEDKDIIFFESNKTQQIYNSTKRKFTQIDELLENMSDKENESSSNKSYKKKRLNNLTSTFIEQDTTTDTDTSHNLGISPVKGHNSISQSRETAYLTPLMPINVNNINEKEIKHDESSEKEI